MPDAIVIGSGPGGSACARALAVAGKDVLLLERGGTVACSACCGEYSGVAYLCRATNGLRRHSAPKTDTCVNRLLPGYGALSGNALGGATAVNFSIWIAPSRRDLARALPAALRTEEVQRGFLRDVDGIATHASRPGVDFELTGAQEAVLRGFERADGSERHDDTRHRGPGLLRIQRELWDDHSDPGPVLGRQMRDAGGVRRNAWTALVDDPPDRRERDAITTLSGCEATRIVPLLEGGYRVETAAHGAFRAPLVFVACSALETPTLLRRSLGGNSRGVHAQLGRNLSEHQQSSTAWPVPCGCGTFAHPPSAMPRHSPVGYAVGHRDETGDIGVEPTHLPFSFSALARPYNLFAGPELALTTCCAFWTPHWVGYTCCCVDFRAQIFREATVDGHVDGNGVVQLPVPTAAHAAVVDAYHPRVLRIIGDALGVGDPPLTIPFRSAWHFAGTARAGPDACCDPCDERAQVRDRDGVPYAGLHVADLSMTARPPMANPMSMAAFCGHAAARAALVSK